MDWKSARPPVADAAGLAGMGSSINAPMMTPLLRSSSTPNGQPQKDMEHQPSLPRSLSAEALFRPHAMDTKEIHGLVQELAYHTNSSNKQLQELCQRLNCFDDVAEETAFSEQPSVSCQASPVLKAQSASQPSTFELSELDMSEALTDNDPAIATVLSEFGLSTRPDVLRAQLRERLRPKVRRLGSRHLTPKSTMELAPDLTRSNTSTLSSSSRPSSVREISAKVLHSQSGRLEGGINSRMAVRLQISRFLQDPRTRVRVLKDWIFEAASISAVQEKGNWLVASGSEDTLRRYGKLYEAFEAMFSNMLDENDSPIREVLFNLMTREAKKWARVHDQKTMPPQAQGTQRAVECFRGAVLKVRSSPSDDSPPQTLSEKNQWDDCLSRLDTQFAQAFEETFRRAWPQAEMALGVIPDEEGAPVVSPLESLKRTLIQNADNADLLCAASRSIASSADTFLHDMTKDREEWNTYLRQGITVSKNFLALAREMTLLTGLWTLGHGLEDEHSNIVLRKEYKRVLRGVADLLLRRQREILDNWSERIAKVFTEDVPSSSLHRDRHLLQKILGAIISWWRTQKSGLLRYACIDVVTLHMKKIDVKHGYPGSKDSGMTEASARLEQILAGMLLFKDVVLEVLQREVAVRDGLLSAVDEPRVLDIMLRLLGEWKQHLISEWDMALAAQAGDDVLPPSKLFQAPNWRRGKFDREAAKTAFLGTIIQNRYVVTRYIHRGSMGRVWQVEEKESVEKMEPFRLCLKTFYTEDECEDMSGFLPGQYGTCVLAELSKVERWMTSCTRLAHSKHLVRVVKVFRKEPAVRQGCADGDGPIEGHINGILMEYCDQGELTSYLWDSKAERPNSFDEETARFLFAQLTDLLIELFAPPMLLVKNWSFDSMEDFNTGSFAWSSNPSSPQHSMMSAAASFAQWPLAMEDEQHDSGAVLVEARPAESREPLARQVPQSAWEESDSPTSLRRVNSHVPAMSPLLEPLVRDKSVALKYFHNDIKTENLVLSGTTLKLIDFESLMPLRPSQMSTEQIQHATKEYSHRCEKALGTSIEARAEGVAVWACGVILVSLLAPELEAPSWVYHKRGLGSQKELKTQLANDHCLLHPLEDRGPRDLLEKIFSKDRTPGIVDVINHPWVQEGRQQRKNRSIAEEVARKLKLREPEAFDPKSAHVAWVPLTHCVLQDGKPAPFEYITEVLELAVSFSGTPYPKFCLDGQKTFPCRGARECGDGEEDDAAAEDKFYEWYISMCVSGIDDDNEGSGNEDDEVEETPQPSIRHRLSTGMSSTSTLGAPKRRDLWKLMRTRMASDRFVVQARPTKDNATEDDPPGVWWLRLKWLPAIVGRMKSATSSILDKRQTFITSMQAGDARLVQSDGFVQLQHLFLEGLNEKQRRDEEEQRRKEEQKREEQRRAQAQQGKPVRRAPMLPGAAFGR